MENEKNVSSLGSIKVTPFGERPWNNEKKIGELETKKRIKGKKAVIHPLFERFSIMCEEDQWKSLFYQCSLGNFPKGFMYKDSALQFKHKKKTEIIMLPSIVSNVENKDVENKDVENAINSALDLCISFFKEHRGYWAEKKGEDGGEGVAVNTNETDVYTQWNHIKMKHIKENYIASFLSKMKEKYSLSNLEFLQLKKEICMGTIKNYIHQHNIVLEDNQISSINGLEFNEKDRLFYFDTSKMKKITRSSSKRHKEEDEEESTSLRFKKKTKTIDYAQQWYKYITSFVSQGHKNGEHTNANDATADDTVAETET